MPRLRVVPPTVPALVQWRLDVDGHEVVPGEWAEVRPGDHQVDLHVNALAGKTLVWGTCAWKVSTPDRAEVEISFPTGLLHGS